MKIEYFDGTDYKIYNPVTNEVVIEEEANEGSESIIALWLDEEIEEYSLKDKTFNKAWEAYSNSYKVANDGCTPDNDAILDFLENYENPLWKVFVVNSIGHACGPFGTVILVVDKDLVFEDKSNLEEN